MINEIIQGSALERLKELDNDSVDCCITSPPYWALRDYRIDGQIGLESDFNTYIAKLIEIFNEVKRVLKRTGSCWINMGDTYNAEKSLCLIPQRFQIQMVDQGWICRNTIIWYKPNCMPSSAKDRFTVDFEYLFFFTKSQRYYFDTQYEAAFETSGATAKRKNGSKEEQGPKFEELTDMDYARVKGLGWYPYGRIKRCVWKIPTQPFSDAHFAVFPPELVETPIKATCPPEGIILDPFIGSGTVGLVALQNARNFLGIELNPEYIRMAYERLDPYLKQQRMTEFA